MTTFHAPTRIRIEAPDATSAFMLERRLAGFHAFVLGRGPSWGVELDDYDDQVDEVAATVRHWLRESGCTSTRMAVGDATETVSILPGAEPIGSEYEMERVLEHDP
jgi:hypothetical protein